jgi:hypothetical protein
VWAVAWLLAAGYVYSAVRGLEDYGEATVTASIGLSQAGRALGRASSGLRETADALDGVPFLSDQVHEPIRRTASDVDRIATTVRTTARQARVTGRQTTDSAQGLAVVLGAAVALVPTLPLVALYVVLRPMIVQRLGAG